MRIGILLFSTLLSIPLLTSADVWHVKRVDYEPGSDTFVGASNCIKLDASDTPHISYLDLECDSLKYSYWDGSGWVIATIDYTQGGSTCLVLDSSEHPHISYYDYDAGHLKYAWFDGLSWQLEVVDSVGNVGSDNSIALDANGEPHISYRDGSNEALAYTYRESNQWIREIVANGGQNNSLTLDEQGRAHISHYNGDQMSLEYAFRGDSGWETCTVYSDWPDYACGLNTSTVLDSSGNPHIGFLIMDTVGWYKSVRYAYRDEQGWHTSTTGCGGFRGDVSGPSLALTSEGIPCMAVDAHDPTDEWDRILFFVHKPDASWVSESVPGSGGSWGAVSMDVDSAGRPHIAYEKWIYQGLHYAYMAPDSADLSIEENEGAVVLLWEPYPGAALYEIHGTSNDPYFFIGPQPGTEYLITTVPSSQTSWETIYGVGDPDENWTFLIIAKDETDAELARSNRVGEHDFVLDYPE